MTILQRQQRRDKIQAIAVALLVPLWWLLIVLSIWVWWEKGL